MRCSSYQCKLLYLSLRSYIVTPKTPAAVMLMELVPKTHPTAMPLVQNTHPNRATSFLSELLVPTLDSDKETPATAPTDLSFYQPKALGGSIPEWP